MTITALTIMLIILTILGTCMVLTLIRYRIEDKLWNRGKCSKCLNVWRPVMPVARDIPVYQCQCNVIYLLVKHVR